eukprot:CAMPEP_0181291050 /NCGR_PEP_ID=MMETSP1101-20121128/1750_1 /TAXON_ID=46948 /ORGANISM="Rhodomonas abbreviata, Strain Caron Lab Isolate" /LENGTH=433 /DNA_ID=CAMNT_0023395395 /DNA_START=500 /DNA_END=1801 /DNA_ORIENTATION=+
MDISGTKLLELQQQRNALSWLVGDGPYATRLRKEMELLRGKEEADRRWENTFGQEVAEDEERGQQEWVEELRGELRVFLVGEPMLPSPPPSPSSSCPQSSSPPSARLSTSSSASSLPSPPPPPQDEEEGPVLLLPLFGIPDFPSLLAAISKELRKPIDRLTTHTGEPVVSLHALPDSVYALQTGQLFVLAAEHDGFEQEIYLRSTNRSVVVETLSVSPRVFYVKSFLHEEECQGVKQIAESRMGYSTIAQPGKAAKMAVETARNSRTAWIHKATDPLIDAIGQRVSELSKAPMRLAEDMQVLHYAVGQHYHSHYDYFDPSIHEAFISSPGRNRFITVLFYLSDVEEGGETVFPLAGNASVSEVTDFSDCSRGLKVKPQSGDALLFYNLLPDKQQGSCPEEDPGCHLDRKSLHAGCDVTKGEKWAANFWIHNKE